MTPDRVSGGDLYLAVFAAFPIGFGALLLGSATPDPRLEIGELSLSPLLFLIFALSAIVFPVPRQEIVRLFLAHVPLVLAFVSIFHSWDTEYGFHKLGNLILSSMVATISFRFVMLRLGADGLLRLLSLSFAATMALGIAYKVQFGLFDRAVPFFLNGPIVFARIMGIGAIVSFFAWRGLWRHLLVLCFLASMVLTFSNGPVLSIAITLPFMYLAFGKTVDRWVFSATLTFAISAIALLAVVFDVTLDLGRLGLIWALVTEGSGAFELGFSSSARLDIYASTIALILERPWGIGLGGWSAYFWLGQDLGYPHNLILELLSECGVMLGLFALAPFFFFISGRRPVFLCLGTFLFLAQQVSGDLLDARYLLAFSVIAYLNAGAVSAQGQADPGIGRRALNASN